MRPQFPFFIVGAQRSGTTLLRLLLNAHSQIAVPEEARFLTPLLTAEHAATDFRRPQLQKIARYLELSEEFELWNFDHSEVVARIRDRDRMSLAELVAALYAAFAASERKAHWGDKSLFIQQIDLLAEIFPTAAFIHIVRDGRDVFDSWRQLDPSRDCAPVTALDWKLKLALVSRAFAKLDPHRVLTVRYEDLIADPEAVGRAVCAFLRIPYEPAMLDYHKSSDRYIGAHHSRLIFSKIDAQNQAKWKERLKPREVLAYDLVAGGELRQFGYEQIPHRYRPGDYLWVAAQFVLGFPPRAWALAADRVRRRLAVAFGTSAKLASVGVKPAGG